MSAMDFTHLREGGPECPSDFALDRLAAGELSEAEARRIEAHAGGCARCPGRIASRRQGWDAVPEIDAQGSLARLRARLDAPPPPSGTVSWIDSIRARLQRWWWPTAGLALAGAAALVIALRPPAAPDDGEAGGTRLKGGPALHVHRLRGTGSEEIESGARLHPGDRLRFVVDLPAEAAIRVVGVGAGGQLYTAWPMDEGVPIRRPAGARQALPGAVELDDEAGAETLWLVACPPAIEPRCSGAPPECPPGCKTARFVIEKGR